MGKYALYEQVQSMKASLIEQGYIDDEFIRLLLLQDENNPDLAEEMVTSFYNDSVKLIDNIEQALESRPLDFGKLDEYILQFKGSSSSIGAKRLTTACTEFRQHCNAQNTQGCVQNFETAKQEHATLKGKLESLFELIRQANSAEFL